MEHAIPAAACAGMIGASYLAGGIPTGFLVVRWKRGFDIRSQGSGNPGTANVYRVAGARLGAITLLVDALKGFLPVLVARRVVPDSIWLPLACGAAAIIGHDWTVFLGFKGGKGVATSAGVFLALAPKAMLASVLVFILGFGLTGHISVGSMLAAMALPAACAGLKEWLPVTLLAAGAALLILYKHIPNLRRLRQGRELLLHEKK